MPDTRTQDFIRMVKGRNDAGLCLKDGCFAPPEVDVELCVFIDIAGRLRFHAGMCRIHAAIADVRAKAAEEAGFA